MLRNKFVKAGVVAVACGALGTGVAFASSALTPQSSPAQQPPSNNGKHAAAHKGRKGAGPFARVVHGDAVVPAQNGQFVNVTFDRGVVQSVQGNTLTLKEGTNNATYKTVTLTIPADAKIRDNKQPAQLSDVKPGQRAAVLLGPGHDRVIARNAP
jgi:hypothetical protein